MTHALTLMAVHAHPDDESLGTGGVLAHYSQHGVRTVLVTCTRGDVGEINDPSLDPEEAKRRLGELRLAELDEAARLLGIHDVEILGYRDSGMIDTEDNEHPDSFWKADLDEATGRLVRLIRSYRPDVLVTYDENGNYGHPDHIQANRITVRAFEMAGDPDCFPEQGLEPWQPKKLYYTAWSRERFKQAFRMMVERGIELPWKPEGDIEQTEWGVPDEALTTTVDVRDYQELKRDALRAHRTQIGPDWFYLKLPPDIAEVFGGWESFTRQRSLVPAPEREDDLFAGLR